MGTTSRFALRYPGLTDAPNGPEDFQFLAEDVEGWLSRAFPCTSTTRPAGVPDWFLIGETDTGKLLRYSTASGTWIELGDSGGGGGGGTGGGFPTGIAGRWRATSNQSLSNGSDTVLAFGNTEASSSVVTRATSGSGHKFTLAEDGIYAITATVRFVPGNTGSRFIELRNSAQSVRYVAAGNEGGPSATTRQFAITDRFPAGAELVVIATQSSGGTLTTQYQGDSIQDGFVRLTIVKIAD